MTDQSENTTGIPGGPLVPRVRRRRRNHIGKLWCLVGAVVLCATAEYLLGDVLRLNLADDFRLILGTALVAGMFVGGVGGAFLMRTEISADDMAPNRGPDNGWE
jgi:hypothetical protein